MMYIHAIAPLCNVIIVFQPAKYNTKKSINMQCGQTYRYRRNKPQTKEYCIF